MHISSLPSPEAPNDQPVPGSHSAQTMVAQDPLPAVQQPPQPGIGARDGATDILPAQTQHAQPQPAALTAAPLLGTPAKRSTPDTGFDWHDANDAKRMRSLPPETPAPAPCIAPRVGANVMDAEVGQVANVPQPPAKAQTPKLIAAIEKGDWQAFCELLAQPEIDVNARDEYGQTALHAAFSRRPSYTDSDVLVPMYGACFSSEKIVRALLKRPEIDIHARDADGHTAYYLAWDIPDSGAIRLLFTGEYEDDKSHPDTLLALAAARGDLAAVETLLADPNVNVNAQCSGGNTALMLAAAHGHATIVRRLLRVPGIDVRVQDYHGNTVLHQVAASGDEAVLRSLLEVPGIDINCPSLLKSTALNEAMINGNDNIALMLLAMPGIDIHAGEHSALTRAVMWANRSMLCALLAMPGIDVNVKVLDDDVYEDPPESDSCLITCVLRRSSDVVSLLLAMPQMDVNAVDSRGNTALIAAAATGDEPALHALLAMPGIRIDIKDAKGRTALSIAEQRGYDDIAQALRNHVPAACAAPETVLHLLQTIFADHVEEPGHAASSSVGNSPGLGQRCDGLQYGKYADADVPGLLSSIDSLPASVRSSLVGSLAFGVVTGHYREAAWVRDSTIFSAIHKAGLHAAFVETANGLFRAARHINLFHVDGMNLLGIAAKDGNERMIRGLVHLGAYVNVPSPNGKTALAIAVENRQWGACAELVFHGALPTLPLHDGYPALYHIVRDFNTDAHGSESLALLIRYLRKKGVPFDILVKNPDEIMRAERPTVPLYELLVTNAQSWVRFRHILFDLQDAAPPAVPAPTTTAAIPGNTLSTL